MTAVAAVGVAATTTMTAVAAMADKLQHRRCSVAFFVEDVERCQADVCNLLFMESDSCAFAFLVEEMERRKADVFLTESDSIVISGL
jgi:hypothetical protein